MPYTLADKLVVGLSSRALFALEGEDAIFREKGLDAYRQHQRDHEGEPLGPGTAFQLVTGATADQRHH
jgi:5'-nucleotidase